MLERVRRSHNHGRKQGGLAVDNPKCLTCGKKAKLIVTIKDSADRGLPYTFACDCLRVSGTTAEEAKNKWLEERSMVSPFSAYRTGIMCGGEFADQLRQLVLNLYDSISPVDIPALFAAADSWQRMIILKLLESHSQRGMNDAAFVTLAEDIKAYGEQGGEK